MSSTIVQLDSQAEVEQLRRELQRTITMYNRACEELVHTQKKVRGQIFGVSNCGNMVEFDVIEICISLSISITWLPELFLTGLISYPSNEHFCIYYGGKSIAYYALK